MVWSYFKAVEYAVAIDIARCSENEREERLSVEAMSLSELHPQPYVLGYKLSVVT